MIYIWLVKYHFSINLKINNHTIYIHLTQVYDVLDEIKNSHKVYYCVNLYLQITLKFKEVKNKKDDYMYYYNVQNLNGIFLCQINHNSLSMCTIRTQ